jgi:cytidylate kinase
MRKLIIAIDGTAGSGKSTTARRLARRLGLLAVDTGALYRALALKAIRTAIPPKDEKALSDLAETTRLDQRMEGGDIRTFLDGEDVTPVLRSKEIDESVPVLARHAGVRRRLVRVQRRLARSGGAVVEGRDIGTVVFRDADLKVFMTASPEVRAKRRRAQLERSGVQLGRDDVLREITGRDRRDRERDTSPLVEAEDAYVIDTTDLTVDEQVDIIIGEIRRRFGREIP